PVFVRISATDWIEGGWNAAQSVVLAAGLKDLGIDLIDVSSGALSPKARIPVGKGYQVPFARQIRDEVGIMTGAVGLITEAAYANEIITGGDADLVFIARELLREPYWALKAQSELGEEPSWPIPYGYAVKRRAKYTESATGRFPGNALVPDPAWACVPVVSPAATAGLILRKGVKTRGIGLPGTDAQDLPPD